MPSGANWAVLVMGAQAVVTLPTQVKLVEAPASMGPGMVGQLTIPPASVPPLE
jgi:hypothetical protein